MIKPMSLELFKCGDAPRYTTAAHGVTAVLLLIAATTVQAQPLQITGDSIAPPAREVLRDIMRESGVFSARITSTFRTPEHQVRAMAGFIHRNGVPAAYRLYGPEGDSIIATYERRLDDSRAERRRAMLEALRRVLPEAQANGRLMHTQEVHFVFDVAVSSIPPDKYGAFAASAREHRCIKRFLGFEEGEKGAFHLEVTGSAPLCNNMPGN